MSYLLSAIICGHGNDVRAVHNLGDQIVSGSRDGTAKLWAQKQNFPGEVGVGPQWELVSTFGGHGGFVSSITAREPDEEFPQGLIYTGCQDGVIRVFEPSKSQPFASLAGHSSNVVTLFMSRAKSLLSGSWDHTAKVWLNDKEVLSLEGHTMGVWAVLVLPETGVMVTGSADKTIKLWKAGKCRKTLEHHTQSVRDLSVISSTEFLSCANDHIILMFKIRSDDTLECDVIYQFEDVDYIYSLAMRNPPTGWVASGEHLGVRVFDKGEITDKLSVPTSSVWSTCVLPNGDIVAGCSDFKIYVFTKDQNRLAPDDIQAVYHAEVERFNHSLTNGGNSTSAAPSKLPAEVGGVKTEDIPGPDALKFPGKRDGQTKMIREGNNVSVHSWSDATGLWSKVGDIVTDPDKSGQNASRPGKTMYEGKEYDHVFSIDIDDNVVLKLPYNNDQDPYQVAQQFIFDHELAQSYLDEIANFIFKNAGVQPSSVGQAVDPFTGSGAYVSGSGGVPTSRDFASGVAADPFTGSGAYVSGSGGVPTAKDYQGSASTLALDPFTGSGAYVSEAASNQLASQKGTSNTFFPLCVPLTFSKFPKMDALQSKLLEFNKNVPSQFQVTEQDVIRLAGLANTDMADASDLSVLLRLLQWPQEYVFPCLDMTRLALLNKPVCQAMLSDDLGATDFLDIILRHAKDHSNPVNQMLSLKVLVNIFSCQNGCDLMVKVRSIVFTEFSSFLPTDNKNVQLGLSTLHLNYSVLAGKSLDSEALSQCLTIGTILLEGITDPESKFRTLVAIGTLLSASPSLGPLATSLDVAPRVKTWKEMAEMPKIVQCGDFILSL